MGDLGYVRCMGGGAKLPPTFKIELKELVTYFLHKASLLHVLSENIKFNTNFDKIIADVSIFDDDVIKNPTNYTIY